MNSRIHYLRLLDEVNQRFDDPDWQQISSWIQDEALKDRVREEPFVPTTIEELERATDPALQPGDVVLSPILARGEQYRVPQRCQLGAGLYALNAVEVGEGVQVAGDLLAGQEIRWRGQRHGTARNLVAPQIKLETPGLFYGGIWCDSFQSSKKGVHIAPGTVVRGVVVVDAPADGRIVIGEGCQLGGLHVQGTVETGENVSIGHIQASGPVHLGKGNRTGYVQATELTVEAYSQVGVAVSTGNVRVGRGAVLDTVRAGANIELGEEIHVTGSVLLSVQGDITVPEGKQWHERREHWFYLLPGEQLRPYDEGERPAESGLLIIRSYTHSLWSQVEQLSGRLLQQ